MSKNANYIDAKVVMLATDKPTLGSEKENICVFKYTNGKLFFNNKNYFVDKNEFYSFAQHLYITSNEEIKEGDWVVCYFGNNKYTIGKTLRNILSDDDGGIAWSIKMINGEEDGWEEYACKKVISTTDSSLIIDEPITGKDISYGIASYVKEKDTYYKSLPQPSKEFIQSYIESYNNGNVIEDVLVEIDIDQEVSKPTFIGGMMQIVEKT